MREQYFIYIKLDSGIKKFYSEKILHLSILELMVNLLECPPYNGTLNFSPIPLL